MFNAPRGSVPVQPDTPIKLYPGNTPPRAVVPAPPRTSDMLELLNSLPFKEYNSEGVPTKMYTIGSVAKLLGRQPVTIRSWEMKGWLPKQRLRTRRPEASGIPGKKPKGRRLYTRNQVEFLMEAHSRFRLGTPNTADWPGFVSHLKTFPNT